MESDYFPLFSLKMCTKSLMKSTTSFQIQNMKKIVFLTISQLQQRLYNSNPSVKNPQELLPQDVTIAIVQWTLLLRRKT